MILLILCALTYINSGNNSKIKRRSSRMNDRGLAPYQTAGRSRAAMIFSALEEKCRLRAALAEISEEISSALPKLSAGELQELQSLCAVAATDADFDVEQLRAQASEEAELARTQRRAMRVTVSRRASQVLGREAELRARRGIFTNSEALINEAVAIAYGSQS
jgi:hypothetical protein